jgi:hypothetical protein
LVIHPNISDSHFTFPKKNQIKNIPIFFTLFTSHQ